MVLNVCIQQIPKQNSSTKTACLKSEQLHKPLHVHGKTKAVCMDFTGEIFFFFFFLDCFILGLSFGYNQIPPSVQWLYSNWVHSED